jgi:flagellar biosynthesis chaperone FliJ
LKRFQFRLETVLRVRRLQEEQAEAALMRANAGARDAARRVHDAVEAYAASDRPDGPQSFDEFHRSRARFERAAGAVDVAHAGHRDALRGVDERRDDWSAAHARVAVLERIESRRREEHDADVRRQEERLVEDLVISRHRRKERA